MTCRQNQPIVRCSALLRLPTVLIAGFCLSFVATAAVAGAQVACQNTPQCVVSGLTNGNVFVDPYMVKKGKIQPAQKASFRALIARAARRGVPEKISISRYPRTSYADPHDAAQALRHFLDFPGVLILIAPNGIGVSSGTLSAGQIVHIEEHVAPYCLTDRTLTCAAMVANLAATQVISDQNAANRNRALFWLGALVVFGAVIAFLMWRMEQARRRVTSGMNDVRLAGQNTLALADNAVDSIELSEAVTMPDEVRVKYDRGLNLRERSRGELSESSSREMLLQGNHDAAEAVLILQGVMRALQTNGVLPSQLESPGPRCFYCGRDDRPPYSQRSISDDAANSIRFDVCSECAAELDQGRHPQMATVLYNTAVVPWWATPTSPWYYPYGGPAWQYWLPYATGMELGTWFGGGWGYGGWEYDGDFGQEGDVTPPVSGAGTADGSSQHGHAESGTSDGDVEAASEIRDTHQAGGADAKTNAGQ